MYKRAIIDPPAKRHLTLVGRWWPNIECWLGSFVVLQGIRTSIAKKPYIFVIFQGGGVRIPAPPLLIRTCYSLALWKKFQGGVLTQFHFLSDNNLGIQLDGHFQKIVYANNNHNGFAIDVGAKTKFYSLTHKVPPIIYSRRQFQNLPLF